MTSRSTSARAAAIRTVVILGCRPPGSPRHRQRSTGSGDIHLILSMELVGICTAILVAIGLVSVFLPAFRASRLDPIEALR